MNKVLIYVTTLFCFFYSFTIKSQVDFLKSYQGVKNAVRELSSGDFITIGLEWGTGRGDILLVKTDLAGNVLWSKTYGDSYYDESKCIQQTSDGGFIIVGLTSDLNGNTDVYLIKTDINGVLQWSQKYGAALSSEQGWWVEQTTDGGYIITGASDRDVYLVKTNSLGNILWDKVFAFTGSTGAVGQNVKQTSDGGYIITGNDDVEKNGLGLEDVYLIKTDATGNIQWKNTYEMTYDNINCGGASSGREVWPLANEYIVAGYVVNDAGGAGCPSHAFFLKVNSNGVSTKIQTYKDPAGLNAGFSSMDITADGGFIAIGGGGYEDNMEPDRSYIVKAKPDLSLQWSRYYGGTAYGTSIRQTRDRGYSCMVRFSGYAILKTDSLGLINCYGSTSMVISQSTVTDHPLTIVVNTIGNQITPNTIETVSNVFANVICPPLGFQISTTTIDVKCKGESTGSATVTPVSGIAPFTYTWNPGGGNTQTVNNLVAGIYTVTVTDNTGATAMASVTITEPAQALAVTVNGNGIICEGDQTILNAITSGGTPNYSLSWSTGSNTNSINISPVASAIYNVTVTDGNGCTALGALPITVNQLPVVSFTSDVTEGCGPLCINFTNTSSASQNLIWNLGDGSPNGSTNLIEHCYQIPGSYNVTLVATDGNGCSNTHVENNFITVHPNPIAAFEANPQSTTILNPTIVFTDLSQGATSWAWTFDDVDASSTLQHPTHTYGDTGSYIVQLIVINEFGCADTAEKMIRINADYIMYIPNTFTPNGDGLNDIFIPKGYGIDVTNYKFWIFDRWGDLIFQSSNPSIGWDGRANEGKDPVQIDTYVWKIALDDILDQHHEYVGHVNIVK